MAGAEGMDRFDSLSEPGKVYDDFQLAISGEVLNVVVLQVSNADKFVAERLSCVLRLPNRKGCR